MTPSGHAAAIRYAFVATGVCGALNRLEKNREFRSEDRVALARAEEFFRDVIGGVSLVIGPGEPSHYTAESLPAANRALSTLAFLQLASEDSQVQSVLEGLHGQLRSLVACEAPHPAEDYDVLKRFFAALSRDLSEEAIDGSIGSDISWDEPS